MKFQVYKKRLQEKNGEERNGETRAAPWFRNQEHGE